MIFLLAENVTGDLATLAYKSQVDKTSQHAVADLTLLLRFQPRPPLDITRSQRPLLYPTVRISRALQKGASSLRRKADTMTNLAPVSTIAATALDSFDPTHRPHSVYISSSDMWSLERERLG